MSWELKLTTWEEFRSRREAAISNADRPALVGLCWYASKPLQASLEADQDGRKLSPAYRRDWLGKRRVLFICMPMPEADMLGFQVWSPDCLPTVEGGEGWTVTGEPPAITTTPSINCLGGYHGYVRDGVLTDDCEGRKYDWDKH